jgi:hypothetical protein
METLFINAPSGKIAEQFGFKNPVSVDFRVDRWNEYSEATRVYITGVFCFNEKLDDFEEFYVQDVPDDVEKELAEYCIEYVNTEAKHLVEEEIERQKEIDAETRMEQMYEDRRTDEYS